MFLQHYFRRYCIQTSYLGNICHFPSHFSQKSRSKWVFGQKNCKIWFFLYFCTGNWISWFSRGRMSLWRHRHRRLGLLVLYLVSMFRGDSKLNIGTKLSIIRGSILKISGGVDTTPPSVRRVTKNGSVRRGLIDLEFEDPWVGVGPSFEGKCAILYYICRRAYISKNHEHDENRPSFWN